VLTAGLGQHLRQAQAQARDAPSGSNLRPIATAVELEPVVDDRLARMVVMVVGLAVEQVEAQVPVPVLAEECTQPP